MSVKFMNALSKGTSSYAAEGIEYAVHKGVKIVNASFGSSSKSSALEVAIEYAKEKGVLIVVAAGNDAKNIDKPMSGTSMAAPLVAGMAGLLRAKNSDATYSNLKTALRRKVDKPTAFKDKVVYDGRVNLKLAIDYIAAL